LLQKISLYFSGPIKTIIVEGLLNEIKPNKNKQYLSEQWNGTCTVLMVPSCWSRKHWFNWLQLKPADVRVCPRHW